MSTTPIVLKTEQFYTELGGYKFRIHLHDQGWSVIRVEAAAGSWAFQLAEKLVIDSADGLTIKWIPMLKREDRPSPLLYIPAGCKELENIDHMLRKYGLIARAD